MAWALPLGVAGALLGWVIRWIGLSLRPVVHRNRVLVTAGLGLAIGLIAMTYQLITDHSFTQVLFSGQDELPDVVAHAADYSLGVLLLVALQDAGLRPLPERVPRRPGVPRDVHRRSARHRGLRPSGLAMAPAIGMGIGAMCAAMLRLPMTSTLLAMLLLGADGLSTTPEIIVAVAVAYLITMILPVRPRAGLGQPPQWAARDLRGHGLAFPL